MRISIEWRSPHSLNSSHRSQFWFLLLFTVRSLNSPLAESLCNALECHWPIRLLSVRNTMLWLVATCCGPSLFCSTWARKPEILNVDWEQSKTAVEMWMLGNFRFWQKSMSSCRHRLQRAIYKLCNWRLWRILRDRLERKEETYIIS